MTRGGDDEQFTSGDVADKLNLRLEGGEEAVAVEENCHENVLEKCLVEATIPCRRRAALRNEKLESWLSEGSDS